MSNVAIGPGSRLRRICTLAIQAPRLLTVALVVALALLPMLRIVWTLGVIGENNLSNDAGPFLIKFLSPVMAGTYRWVDFPRDTFLNTHSNLFPGLVFILLARSSHLEAHAILYLGVLMAMGRLWLLKDVIVRSCPPGNVIERAALLLGLTGLVFSISQMSVYEFPLLSIKYGLCNLGTALGVWGLVRLRGSMAGVLLASAGALVATLSNATGFALWAALLIGMWLLDFRKLRYILLLLAVAAISVLPYVFFLFLSKEPPASSTVVSVFRPILMLNILGRPFADNIGTEFGRLAMSEAAASIGIVLCIVAGVLLWVGRTSRPIRSVAPYVAPSVVPLIALVTVGLLTACQISVFRNQIAPWYTSVVMDFWIGLVGLAYFFWTEAAWLRGRDRRRPNRGAARVWSIAAASAIAALYLSSNLSRADKSFYVASRAPASVACLRNYLTAPTYCECLLAGWQPGNPRYLEMLGRPLKENHLSVFAPHQEWSLQGDSILGNVEYDQAPGADEIYWAAGIGGDRAAISDYRRLNLVLEAPDSVSWTIAVPPTLDHGEFRSAVARITPSLEVTHQAACKVSIRRGAGPETVAYSRALGPSDTWWNDFKIALDHFAGETITVRLSLEGLEEPGPRAAFQYPCVDFFLKEPVGPDNDLGPIVPSNTDLSSLFPKTTPNDYLLNLQDPGLWSASGPVLDAAEPLATWSLANATTLLSYIGPLPIQLDEYSHLYVRVAASEEVLPRAILVKFSFDGEPVSGKDSSAVIPLLADTGPHGYTLDLKLLNRPSANRLTRLTLQPLPAGFTVGNPTLQVLELRFIRKLH